MTTRLEPAPIPSNDPIAPDVRVWHGIPRRDLVVVAILPTLLLAGMTSTFTDLARPFVVNELSSDRYRYQWVLACTLLGSVTGMSLIAWMRNRIGLKNSYVIGLIIFTLGSLACATAPNMELLGVTRFVQGWGNGMVVTTVLAVFWREFPDHRDAAIAAYVLGLYFGRIVAPSVSAYLINLPSWRSIFYFNVPIAAISVVLTSHLLQADEPRERVRARFDFEGLVLLLGWVLCLMLGLFRFQKWGWYTSNDFWLVTAMGLALFVSFVVHEFVCHHPLLDLRLFAIPRFTLSVAIKALADLCFFTVVSVLVRYMAVTRDYERVTTGLVLLPAVAAMGTTLALTAWLGTRDDRKARLVVGLIGMSLGTWYLSSLDLYTDKFWTALITAAWAAAAGLVASPLICISQEEMTPDQIASSAGIKNLMLVLPAFVGNNLLGIFIERRGDSHFDAMRQSFVPNRPPLEDVRLNLVDYFTLQGLGPADAAAQAVRLLTRFTHDYATVFAFQSAFQILALIMMLAVVLACCLKPLPPQATGPRRG
ncbi:drug resistance transporter, EmrB/QacA subfamily [Singulisphaera sp. GP187]|uniref:MFS transporter n=1 Tax=Singulisphaera sp. GP187 TaxID=1882752 RepID=UPI00092CDF10|nr:MFS transporter [Singulisphaera sp. GP187]SIN85329.1 drug resistance transporter, EmrB/QacA subfamily [Singulisphaera sp. GP187]